MKPIKFKEQNKILIGFPQFDIGDLPVFEDHNKGLIMSCWKMSFKERLRALLFGKVWLQVKSKHTHPPVSLFCGRAGFEWRIE